MAQLSAEIIAILTAAREAAAEVAALADPGGVLVVKYGMDFKARTDLSRASWNLANRLESLIRGGINTPPPLLLPPEGYQEKRPRRKRLNPATGGDEGTT